MSINNKNSFFRRLRINIHLIFRRLKIPNSHFLDLLAILVGIVIVGGIKRIGQTTEKIVPSMVAIYISASLYIIITNISFYTKW